MNKKAAKAAQELSRMDHCILSREEAIELAEAMGLPGQDVPLCAIEHRPDTLKGARLKGCTEIGEKRYAIGADDLAEWACQKLNVEYESRMGRGATLRECCTRLYERFTK